MLLDDDGVARELMGLGVGDREALPIVFGNIDRRRRMPRFAVVRENHPDGLRAHRLAQNRRPPRSEIGLVDVELVRIHRALDDGLAETVRRRDEHDLVKARFGVEREHHAGGAEVASHHLLDACGQSDLRVRVPLMDSIRNRPIVVEACEYLSYCMKYII